MGARKKQKGRYDDMGKAERMPSSESSEADGVCDERRGSGVAGVDDRTTSTRLVLSDGMFRIQVNRE